MNQTHAHFWMQKQLQRVETSCRTAIAQINTARDMEAVIRAANVSVPSEVRAVFKASPEHKRLRSSVTRRLEQLGSAQLGHIEQAADYESAKEMFGRFLSREWQACRGEYGNVLVQLERKGRQLLHKKLPTKQVAESA